MLHTDRGHTNIFYRSFNNVGPCIWNALQNKMDENVPISQFKQNNKKYLQDHSLTCHCVPKVVVTTTPSYKVSLNTNKLFHYCITLSFLVSI